MRTMERAATESVIATIAVLATAVVAYLFYRQARPRRDFLANRPEDLDVWRDYASPERLEFARTVLEAVCDAFPFKRRDIWRFRPDDKLQAIYESFYPRGLGLPDGLEYENLFDTLHKRFRVPKVTIRKLWAREPTLADIVACCLRYCHQAGVTEPSGGHSERSDLRS